MKSGLVRVLLGAAFVFAAARPLLAQSGGQQLEPRAPAPTQGKLQAELARYTCPGDPPGNLTSLDCHFTLRMWTERFVGNAVTDKAIVGASFFGLVAHLRDSPPEWDRGWDGFGRRVGSRYSQNFAKGTTAFVVGAVGRLDPRPTTCATDPSPGMRCRRGGFWARSGHAVLDWATVRRSDHEGDGMRLPNVPLFAGATASAFTGNLWYPDRQRTRADTLRRIGGSLGTALFNSFWDEFQPEVGRALGRIARRGAESRKTSAEVKPRSGGGDE